MAKVGVALSGGVDSSVAALILQRQGHEVVGLTLRLGHGASDSCEAGAEIAGQMGFPHRVVEARNNFERQVVAPMVADYASGKTPNPCARCNAMVKFPLLWSAAQNEGCRALATGHYVGIEQVGNRFYFSEAADLKKSQAYFLARVEASYLNRLLFPLGGFTKEKVRDMAAQAGLGSATRRESQDLCFLPAKGLDDLMQAHKAIRRGPLEDEQGKVLGRHQGLHRFTIGQRRGLGVALGAPRYVLALDEKRAAVKVGPESGLWARGLWGENAHWYEPPQDGQSLSVRCRYNHRGVGCKTHLLDDKVRVEFAEPIRAVAPGQLAVFSRGKLIVGSAWITKAVF